MQKNRILNHSIAHSPSLFDAPGNRSFGFGIGMYRKIGHSDISKEIYIQAANKIRFDRSYWYQATYIDTGDISTHHYTYRTLMPWLHVKWNYFSLRRRPYEIIIFHAYIKLFQNYFSGLLQLVNIFQHVQCRRKKSEITPAAEINLFQFQTWLHLK